VRRELNRLSPFICDRRDFKKVIASSHLLLLTLFKSPISNRCCRPKSHPKRIAQRLPLRFNYLQQIRLFVHFHPLGPLYIFQHFFTFSGLPTTTFLPTPLFPLTTFTNQEKGTASVSEFYLTIFKKKSRSILLIIFQSFHS